MVDSEALKKAKSFFINGLEKLNKNDLTGAEIDFETSLQFAPNRLSSLINLSIVLIKLNKYQDAERIIQMGLLHHPKNKELLMSLVEIYTLLIKHKPEYAEAHNNLGSSYKELNMLDEASTSFNFAIKLNPNLAEAYSNKGSVLHETQNYIEALEYYDKAISLKNSYAEAYTNRGNALLELLRIQEAIESQNKAIEINSSYANAYLNRGIIFYKVNRFKEALNDFQSVILLKPDSAEAYSHIGNAQFELLQYQEAIKSQNKAIEIDPNYAEAYSNRGIIMHELKEYKEALNNFDIAISLNPNFAQAYSNRGNTLKEMMQFEESLDAYSKAITLKPDYAEAYSNRGVILKQLNKNNYALIDYDTAISIDPKYLQAQHNKAILLLQLQQFAAGWDLYQHRWEIKNQFSKKLDTTIPYWNGQITNPQTNILLWAEQGIGDEIFYAGMLKNFADIEARVTVSADTRLHALFKRSMPEVEFIDKNEIANVCNESIFDFQAPIGDIGLLCSVGKSLEQKASKPFLQINHSKCSDIKNKNPFLSGKFVCGISWKSNNKDIGIAKSLNLIDLSPLFSIENVEFVSLQYGSTADEIAFVEKNIGVKIHTIDELDIFNDIDGLASLISLCDLVVTTSSITAHLTGAVGKKGLVLMPYSKGKIWYWHSGVGKSLWYPSLELVSQTNMNDWTDPINKCKETILKIIGVNYN